MRIIFAILLVLFSSSAYASTTINCQIVRGEAGSGITQISSGFPLPPGLVTEAMVTGGLIKVYFNGSEVAANVTGLRGRHSTDPETLRSILIQFQSPSSMTQSTPVSGSVVIDGGARTSADPTYIRPTLAIVEANNVIFPAVRTGTGYESADKAYIASTQVTFQKLLAAGLGTAEEEKQYTTLANTAFDALVITQEPGGANYEEVRASLALWARTGDLKYYNQALYYSLLWLPTSTPADTTLGGRDCVSDPYVNPDSRTTAVGVECGYLGETTISRLYSFASMYLMTGYRDFWSIVAYNAQYQQWDETDQTLANDNDGIVWYTSYDYPRFNFAKAYGAMLPAFMIDATMAMSGNYVTGRTYNWSDQLEWTLTALAYHQWNIKWIPYNSGTGNVPAVGTNITQSGTGASATLMTVGATKNDSMTAVGEAMPTSGYIMVRDDSGTFGAGALTNIGATATGAAVADTRNGMVGVRPNSIRTNPIGIPYFQLIYPLNFLIDYYLNVDADSRIPGMVKANIDIILNGIKPLISGDHNYGLTSVTWGNTYWGQGYPAENPVDTDRANPWSNAEYTRMIAFVLKTVDGASSMTVNDALGNPASYATWYSRLVDTANNWALADDAWKNFGQFYGYGSDAPWINAQPSIPAPTYRTPTQWNAIPDWNGAPPDLARASGAAVTGNKWKISSITDDQQ